jgi:hypothetical protein
LRFLRLFAANQSPSPRFLKSTPATRRFYFSLSGLRGLLLRRHAARGRHSAVSATRYPAPLVRLRHPRVFIFSRALIVPIAVAPAVLFAALRLIMPTVLMIIFVILAMTFHSAAVAAHVILAVPFALTGGVLLQWPMGCNFSVAV